MISLSFIVVLILLARQILLKVMPDVLPNEVGNYLFGGILAIVALVLDLIGIIVFSAGVPGAYTNGGGDGGCSGTGTAPQPGCTFIGKSSDGSFVWGPSTGWIVEVINIFVLLGIIVCYFVGGQGTPQTDSKPTTPSPEVPT